MPIGKAHWTALGARVRLQGMAEKSISGCWDSTGSQLRSYRSVDPLDISHSRIPCLRHHYPLYTSRLLVPIPRVLQFLTSRVLHAHPPPLTYVLMRPHCHWGYFGGNDLPRQGQRSPHQFLLSGSSGPRCERTAHFCISFIVISFTFLSKLISSCLIYLK